MKLTDFFVVNETEKLIETVIWWLEIGNCVNECDCENVCEFEKSSVLVNIFVGENAEEKLNKSDLVKKDEELNWPVQVNRSDLVKNEEDEKARDWLNESEFVNKIESLNWPL